MSTTCFVLNCCTVSANEKPPRHSRLETREGQQRPINKDYYYVDFHATIDAIKYRMFRLTQKVKEMYKPSEEKKDFFCPRCKAQWTELEVLDKFGPKGFECHRCGGLLEREEPDAGDSTGHAKQSKLMSQLTGLLKMLEQVDSEDIPHNDFDTALSLAVGVDRNNLVNPQHQRVPLNGPKPPPAAVKGMLAQSVAAHLDVSVTTGSEKTTAEQAAEAQRKATIAAQNVLPVWHTTSTVTGEITVAGKKDGEPQANGGALLEEEEDEKKISTEDEQLEAYYAEIEREREKEAREQEEASEDEDEGDFEDVLEASPNGTPSSSMSGTPKASQPPQPRTTGSVKGKGSDSGSSAPATNTSTPAGSGQAVEDGEGPVSKKVKFEKEERGESAAKQEVGEQEDKDSDEDEEGDFEDAL